MKLKIGIDNATRSHVVGSVVIAMVIIDSNFSRKFPSIRGKLLTRKERDNIVNTTKKYVKHHFIYRIKPEDIKEDDLNDLEAKAMIECLNSYPEFWKHDIYINLFDPAKEHLLERIKKFLPHNLKNIDLSIDKWHIMRECNKKHRPCSLASIYSKSFSDLEYDDIKRVYGDFGSGSPEDPKTRKFILNNKDCPHLRTSWRSYKDIIKAAQSNSKRKVKG